MAYSDPQSVDPGSGAVSLPRTGSSSVGGTFTSNDSTLKLVVDHVNGRRSRHRVRLNLTKITADPLVPSQNVRSSMSAYLVVDRPLNGITADEAKDLILGLTTWLTASSAANAEKLVGFEI